MKAVVGIDLGTSNCSWSTAPARANATPEPLVISQWVEGRRQGEGTLLPSVLYAPAPEELPEVAAGQWIAGRYARERVRETTGRGIVSAKSWLCHSGVDRNSALLPWGVEQSAELEPLSPVEASERFLVHLRDEFRKRHPQLSLENSKIILTVPASFDPVARQLTLQAAERAGLAVQLLEEPQAAFYDYMHRNRPELTALLAGRRQATVLVCDVGGGTLDLTLIEILLKEGNLSSRRRAVGRHLLLGGDNMDLSLAHWAKPKLTSEKFSERRFGQLIAACRRAKEVLLGPKAPDSYRLQLLAEGSSLLGKSLSLELRRDEVEGLLLDGFFPRVALADLPRPRKSGFFTSGLGYESDPAITRHIAAFLRRNDTDGFPQALLLNGGVARSPSVVSRLVDCLQRWGGEPVTHLANAEVELAVSRGAALHGLSLLGYGSRVEGGAPRGYYIGLAKADGHAERQAVCVVPKGTPEGERCVANGPLFDLIVGKPARFDLFFSDVGHDAAGTLVGVDRSHLVALPSLVTEVRSDSVEQVATVELEGEISSVGTLDLSCRLHAQEPKLAERDPVRFRLDFDLRSRGPQSQPAVLAASPSASEKSLPLAAVETLGRVFGKGKKGVEGREVKDLIRTLENSMGPRKDWGAKRLRSVADVLLRFSGARLRTEEHERLYWRLLGFCLRPGFGMPGDAERLERLWPLFAERIRYRQVERNWRQFWIAWRRVAGGLDADRQVEMRELFDPHLAPLDKKRKKLKGFKPLALDEMLALASQLERVPSRRRAELGNWLIERTWVDRDPRLWQYVSWLGARFSAYGPAECCVDSSIVCRWLNQLMQEKWQEVTTAAQCAFSLARVTGDQREVSEALRSAVAKQLMLVRAPLEWIRAVQEHVPVDTAGGAEWFGESLPVGLALAQDRGVPSQ